MKRLLGITLLISCIAAIGPSRARAAEIELLDHNFNLPEGFHLYRYIKTDLVRRCYSIAFDPQGQMYVGSGERIVRVLDNDADGIADASVEIAADLGDRGPQGLLFLEDRIFANGNGANWILGDLDENGIPQSRRQIGGPVKTGGDHDAHALVRGLDGYVYWLAGNDSQFTPAGHITETNSPIREPLGSTVFRISPDGEKWEAISTGARNPYDIAMNDLGEWFTVDSDHEGQIGLPYYRPVRVLHYGTGGRMGWLSWGDGKLMPYQIDNQPGLYDVGRASPTGLLFYQHNQFPEKYKGVLFMGDYMNKRGENLLYATTGMILAFRFNRTGSTWHVEREEFIKPAQESGLGPRFAVIDMTVAPDGSLLATTSGDGVYRIYYDPENKGPQPLQKVSGVAPGLSPMDEILAYPQPGDSWAYPRLNELAAKAEVEEYILGRSNPVADRVQAFRVVAPRFRDLKRTFLESLTQDPEPEIRAQAAWLIGLRAVAEEDALLVGLLADKDPLVQRRALEALARFPDDRPADLFLPFFEQRDVWVRFAAMHALSHRDPANWFDKALPHIDPRVRTAALAALSFRPEAKQPSDALNAKVSESILRLWHQAFAVSPPDLWLEILRVTQIWLKSLDETTKSVVADRVPDLIDHADLRVVKEAAHLAGPMNLGKALPNLIWRLPDLPDPVLQLHFMDQIAFISESWNPKLVDRVITWLDASDEGWHGDRAGKGSSYPGWWARSQQAFIDAHPDAVRARIKEYHLTGPWGERVLADAETKGAATLTLSGVDVPALRKLREERILAVRKSTQAADAAVIPNETIRKFVLSSGVEGGMAELGQEIFLYQCALCHDPQAAMSRRGPDLAQIRSGTPEHVIDSILEPSKIVQEEYRSHLVTLVDGEVITGLLLEENADEVTYAAEGDPIEILKADIEQVMVTESSPMPEGLLNAMTWNEIRDLWAYLRAGVEEQK